MIKMSVTGDDVIDDMNRRKDIVFRMYLVEEFVKKQDMGDLPDEVAQFKCIREEVDELFTEWILNEWGEMSVDAEVEEMADVLVTLFVFAEMRGYLHDLEKAFHDKMEVNVKKPVRDGKGMKVNKG